MRPSVRNMDTVDDAGGKLSVSRRHKPDYQILLFMGLLMMLGLIIMYAIGPQRAHVLNDTTGTDYSSIYFFVKQAISLGLALVAFVIMTLLPVDFLRKYASKILMIGFILCGLLWVAGELSLPIAQCTNGACRWFELGPLGSLQPAELLKFGVLLFLAGFLGMRARQGLINDRDKTLIPVGVVSLAAIVLVIVAQQDMGTGLSLIAVIASMFVMSGVRFKIIGSVFLAMLAMLVLLIVVAPHRMERIATFFQGDNHSLQDGENYHIMQAKIAVGTGGWSGLGIGNSVQATGYLPEAINDSVFAILAEMFGFVGSVIIILLFAALLLRLLRVADYLEDMRLKLIAVGVFGWLAAHVVLNIAAMIAIVPLTGITLPLLSFGGTSMIFMAGALGLVFQLSRYTNFTLQQGETGYEDSSSRRGIGRTRHTGRRRVTSS